MNQVLSRLQGAARTGVLTGTMLLLGAFPVLGAAQVATAATPPTWDVRGDFTINFHCVSGCSGDYPHAMNVASENFGTGDFSGTGHYIPDTSYTWDMTGNTTGDSLTFTIVYTGTLAGYTYTLTGVIDEDGNLAGTASGMGQTFTWDATGQATEAVGNGVQPAGCMGTYTHVIQGTSGNDNLKGTAANDLIFGYGGNDKITGASGDDCIVGGTGKDTIDAGSGADVVYGNGGADSLTGGAGSDVVYGNAGDDKLSGGTGNDTVVGGNGTDSADGGTGTDSCSAETTKKCE